MLKNLIAALALALSASITEAQSAANLTFTWTLPAAREDGTALAAAEIESCQIYEISATGAKGIKAATITAQSGGTVAATYSMLSVTGTKRYAMTCTDAQGLESSLSNTVLVTTSRPRSTATLQVRVVFVTAQP